MTMGPSDRGRPVVPRNGNRGRPYSFSRTPATTVGPGIW
jgi:hypothetical protein